MGKNYLENSVGAETLTIVSTGEYNNLIEYEVDPSTLSGLTRPETMILIGFTMRFSKSRLYAMISLVGFPIFENFAIFERVVLFPATTKCLSFSCPDRSSRDVVPLSSFYWSVRL